MNLKYTIEYWSAQTDGAPHTQLGSRSDALTRPVLRASAAPRDIVWKTGRRKRRPYTSARHRVETGHRTQPGALSDALTLVRTNRDAVVVYRWGHSCAPICILGLHLPTYSTCLPTPPAYLDSTCIPRLHLHTEAPPAYRGSTCIPRLHLHWT
jgi:hypothetical protein